MSRRALRFLMTPVLVAGVFLAGVLFSLPAQAQLVQDDEILEIADPEVVLLMVNRWGTGEIKRDVINWPFIEATSDGGFDYVIDFYGCGEGDDCDTLWFRGTFGQTGLTYEDVNRFNRDINYGRMVIGGNGETLVQMELGFQGTLNAGALNLNVRLFNAIMWQAGQFLAEND